MNWTRSIEHSPWWFVQMQVLLLGCRVVVVVVAVAVAADWVELLPRMKVRLAQVEVKSWEILRVLLEKEYVTLQWLELRESGFAEHHLLGAALVSQIGIMGGVQTFL